MVLLAMTSRILSTLQSLPASCRQELDLPSEPALDAPISHEQLIRLARHFRENRGTKIHTISQDEDDKTLNALLRGTRIYVPPPPKKPEPSPEYLALKARLLAAVEKDAYNQMISPSSQALSTRAPGQGQRQGPSPIFASSTPTLAALHDNQTISSEGRDAHGNGHGHAQDDKDPLTPSLVLNIFLSVIISGFSVYWALTRFATPGFLTFSSSSTSSSSSSFSSGREGMSEPVRVLVSFLAALLVAVAEVGIYAAYLRKVERARGRERKVREWKVVVGREEVRARGTGRGPNKAEGMAENEGGVDESKSERIDVDVDEIWGRGVNGGVRRRVREKWEERQKDREAQQGDMQ